MKDDIKKGLAAYPNIRKMLRGMRKQLWDILLPQSIEELAQMEANIVAFRKRAAEREQVMAIQHLCGMPLQPNAELREVQIKAKIQGLIKERMRNRGFDDRRDRR